MQLVKEGNREFWVNDKGLRHGEYKDWWDNGQLFEHCFYVNDEIHGEYKRWYITGELRHHKYFSHGIEIRDFIKVPVEEEDKFMLSLEHGGQWICN